MILIICASLIILMNVVTLIIVKPKSPFVYFNYSLIFFGLIGILLNNII